MSLFIEHNSCLHQSKRLHFWSYSNSNDEAEFNLAHFLGWLSHQQLARAGKRLFIEFVKGTLCQLTLEQLPIQIALDQVHQIWPDVEWRSTYYDDIKSWIDSLPRTDGIFEHSGWLLITDHLTICQRWNITPNSFIQTLKNIAWRNNLNIILIDEPENMLDESKIHAWHSVIDQFGSSYYLTDLDYRPNQLTSLEQEKIENLNYQLRVLSKQLQQKKSALIRQAKQNIARNLWCNNTEYKCSLSLQLCSNDPRYNPEDDNILFKFEALKVLEMDQDISDFNDRQDGKTNLPLNQFQHCYLFHELTDHQHMPIGDLLSIGNIDCEIQNTTQYFNICSP